MKNYVRPTSSEPTTNVFEKNSEIPKLEYVPYRMIDKDDAIIRIHINSINNIISSIRSDLSGGIYKDQKLSDYDKELAINLLDMAKRILQNSTTKNEEKFTFKASDAKYCRYVCLQNKVDDGVIEYTWNLVDYTDKLTAADLGIPSKGFVYTPNGLPVPSGEALDKLYIVDNTLYKES